MLAVSLAIYILNTLTESLAVQHRIFYSDIFDARFTGNCGRYS